MIMNEEKAVQDQTQELNSADTNEMDAENSKAKPQKPRSETMALFSEFVEFLGERKKFWLLPIVIVMVLLGALIVFTSSSAIAPFIYTIF